MHLAPVMDLNALKAVLNETKAVILVVFGKGNMKEGEFMDILTKVAQEKDTLLVVMSQCRIGMINDIFEPDKTICSKDELKL